MLSVPLLTGSRKSVLGDRFSCASLSTSVSVFKPAHSKYRSLRMKLISIDVSLTVEG